MTTRSKLAALTAAGALALGTAGMTLAVAPTYDVGLTIAAAPTSVPAGGASVLFTVDVTGNAGTSDLLTVNVSTDNVGCTLSTPTGDDGDSKLEAGETWSYTCTVTGVMPDTTVNATVYACHANGGACDAEGNDDSATDAVTVTLAAGGESTAPTLPPTMAPTDAVAGAGDVATPPNTAAIATSSDTAATGPVLLLVILGLLAASALILRPAKASRRS